jgi:hypothetical protein
MSEKKHALLKTESPFSQRMTLRQIWASLEKKFISLQPKTSNRMIRRLLIEA